MPQSPSTTPTGMHEISLELAIEMTTRFRNEKENILQPQYRESNILPICETFNKEMVMQLLLQPTCESIRIYYSMDAKLKLHAILVGVDATGADILTGLSTPLTNDDDAVGVLLEDATRCPHDCPPPSPLNN